MAIDKITNEEQSAGGGEGPGESSKSTLEFKSLTCVDMKKLSQSELYTLSQSELFTSDDFNIPGPEYVVVPEINSDHTTTTTTTATSPSRIFAFSNRHGPRRSISASVNVNSDPELKENRVILNSLEKLITEGEANDLISNPQRGTAEAVGNAGGVQKRKRKRKLKVAEENWEEFGVIDVNGEEIDLKFLAIVADGAFEAELNRLTEGMVGEDEFLGFLKGLEGRWGSSRRRRKYVDAAVFLKALPMNWKILLSLRPRVRRPSLYCRRFVSPSDDHFKSCKDVALHLKSQFVTNDVNPSQEEDEEAMTQTESDCQVDLGSVGQVPIPHHPVSKVDSLGTNDMHIVPVYNLIECYICRSPFTSIGGLECHLQTSHRANILDMNTDASTRKKRSVPHGLLLIREPKYPPPVIENSVMQKTVVINKETVLSGNELNNIPMNGEGSSNAPKNNSEGNTNLKAKCVWCLVEFFREPDDAETLATSSRFICPTCKNDVSWRFETAMNNLAQHARK